MSELHGTGHPQDKEWAGQRRHEGSHEVWVVPQLETPYPYTTENGKTVVYIKPTKLHAAKIGPRNYRMAVTYAFCRSEIPIELKVPCRKLVTCPLQHNNLVQQQLQRTLENRSRCTGETCRSAAERRPGQTNKVSSHDTELHSATGVGVHGANRCLQALPWQLLTYRIRDRTSRNHWGTAMLSRSATKCRRNLLSIISPVRR